MSIENIKKVGVLGSGLMGAQIAEYVARVGGYQVVMWDLTSELLNAGFEAIRNNHKKFFVEKGKMTAEEAKQIEARIRGVTDMAEAGNTDLVIEAVIEKKEIKQKVFKQLDGLAPERTLFASNTSYLNISDMAGATNRRDRFVGMHFFNPVAMMKLVEVVRGTLTSDDTVKTVSALARKLGKEPVVCRDISFGFIANRVFRACRTEAIKLVAERAAAPRDIDNAMKLGFNWPMGPLETSDMTGGWGIAVNNEEDAIKELGPNDGQVHPFIKAMVRAGYTGGRGKKGIYAFWDEVASKW